MERRSVCNSYVRQALTAINIILLHPRISTQEHFQYTQVSDYTLKNVFFLRIFNLSTAREDCWEVLCIHNNGIMVFMTKRQILIRLT